LLVLLVFVDNDPVSFSAVGAHVLPGLVKSILEHVDCRSIYNMLRQTVPDVDEKNDLIVDLHLGLNNFQVWPRSS